MSRSPAPPPRSRPQVELRNNLPTCRQSSRKASEVCGWSLALIEEFNPSPQGDGDVSEGRKDGRFRPTGARGGGSWHGRLSPPRLLRRRLWTAFAAPVGPRCCCRQRGLGAPRWGCPELLGAPRAGGRQSHPVLDRPGHDRGGTGQVGAGLGVSPVPNAAPSHPGPGSPYGIRGYRGALPRASRSPPLSHFAAP